MYANRVASPANSCWPTSPSSSRLNAILQHPLRLRRFRVDLGRPLQRHGLQLGVVDDLVDRAHAMHLLGGVGAAEEEDLAGELLADLPGQIRAAVAAVEAADVGVGLLEPGVLAAGQRQVADRRAGCARRPRPTR